jgi:Fe2+ or Zn2+ uptake regulation protein
MRGVAARDLHNVIATRLRAADHVYTAGRRRLVEVLASSREPMTLPELLASDRSLVQSSVYRNLAVLEQVGVVSRIVTGLDHASYELGEALTGHHHHHLVCSRCGEVSDFTLAPAVEAELERVLAAAARKARYDVEHHRLDLVGRCSSCR